MNAFEIIFAIALLLFSVAIILVVLLQEGNQKNLGAVTGGADTFLSKNKARSVDAFWPAGQSLLPLASLCWCWWPMP